MLFLSIALAGGCNFQTLKAQMSVLDGDLANRWWAVEEQAKRVEREITCVKDTLSATTAIEFHQQMAVAAHIRKDFDTAAEHLVAAWLAFPLVEFPAGIPSTSPARGRFAAMQEEILDGGAVSRLDRMAYVDGYWTGWAYAGLPVIVQEPGKKARIQGKPK